MSLTLQGFMLNICGEKKNKNQTSNYEAKRWKRNLRKSYLAIAIFLSHQDSLRASKLKLKFKKALTNQIGYVTKMTNLIYFWPLPSKEGIVGWHHNDVSAIDSWSRRTNYQLMIVGLGVARSYDGSIMSILCGLGLQHKVWMEITHSQLIGLVPELILCGKP